MNFILFNPDEMRADTSGCYGHPLVKTPNLDKLAAQGTRFEQAHVTHTVCSPSRCSMMTGWHPHVHGHRSLWHLLRPDEPNLLQYLHDAGYYILWAGKNDVFAPETLERDVDRYGSAQGKRGFRDFKIPFDQDDPRYYSFLMNEAGAYEDSGDYANVQQAIEYLQNKDDDQPFVIYLPLSNPHPPYCAPKGYHDMYDPADIPPLRPVQEAGKPDYVKEIRKSRRLDEMTDAHFRDVHAKYLGQVTYLDALFGDLMEALAASPHADDTAIVFWSDHGDWAGDYGLVEKWPAGLDDTLTRIPLVIRVPNGAEGHVVTESVEHHDIMPTVLELAGIQCQHSHFAQSMVPQLQGAAGNPERMTFAEGGYDLPHDYWCYEGRPDSAAFTLAKPGNIYYPKIALQNEQPHTVCRSASVRTQTHKLIQRTKQCNELYDLVKDPLELNNVYDDPNYAAVRQELTDALLNWYVSTADVTPWYENPRNYEKQTL